MLAFMEVAAPDLFFSVIGSPMVCQPLVILGLSCVNSEAKLFKFLQ